jgi:hypothetical protein
MTYTKDQVNVNAKLSLLWKIIHYYLAMKNVSCEDSYITDLLNRRPFVTEFILEKREVLTLHSS